MDKAAWKDALRGAASVLGVLALCSLVVFFGLKGCGELDRQNAEERARRAAIQAAKPVCAEIDMAARVRAYEACAVGRNWNDGGLNCESESAKVACLRWDRPLPLPSDRSGRIEGAGAMIHFYVGQKVVCVNSRGAEEWTGRARIVEGEIYTVRWFGADHDGDVVVKLAEIIRPHPNPAWNDTGYFATRFRPLVETDISVFTAMLAPTLAPIPRKPERV